MIIVSTQNTFDWSEAQLYRFAGEQVLFQTPCATLKAFHISEAPLELIAEASLAVQEHFDREPLEKPLRPIYEGPAPFGNREREVAYLRRRKLARIELEGETVCEVDFDHNHIHLTRDGGFANLVNVELVTGPAMMVILSRLKTYCLHASAVVTSAGVVAFIGESGAGKSTLAWEAGAAWQQISDDILPILYDKERSGVRASSNFPQLKLANSVAPSVELGSPNLDFLMRINPKPAKSILFRPMSKTEGMLQFVRHTVAAKLFDSRVMERHTKFATYVANRVPMIELSYPRDLLQVTELRESIIDHLSHL